MVLCLAFLSKDYCFFRSLIFPELGNENIIYVCAFIDYSVHSSIIYRFKKKRRKTHSRY